MMLQHKYYFDYAATTPIREEIYTTYCKVLKTHYMNSEAVYSGGLEVHSLVEASRKRIASLLQVLPEEVIFTSGASEANSFAIKGYALKYRYRGKHIIASKMEHSSVMNALEQLAQEFGFSITYLPVDTYGKVSLTAIQKAIRKDTIMVCLMALNNEIGSMQDVDGIASYLHDKRIAFMCDGVQIVGKHPISLRDVDLFTFTTHKFYGVKGCGVLIKKRNIDLLPLIHGGQQEQGLRGGTLNAPACIIAAKTLRYALEEQEQHLAYVKRLKTMIMNELELLDDIVINSIGDTSPYIINFSVLKMNSEIMMNALNERGIFVSSQSACSSRTKSPSHTLLAMGLDEKIAYGAIRISLSHLTTEVEVAYLMKSIKEILNEYRT